MPDTASVYKEALMVTVLLAEVPLPKVNVAQAAFAFTTTAWPNSTIAVSPAMG